MNTRMLLIGLTALIIAGNATAEKQVIRKWVDENGVTHYSTHAPTGVSSSTITANGGTAIPSSSSKAKKPFTGSSSKSASKPKTQQFASEDEPAYKAARKKNCEIAKQNIQVLMNSPVVTQKDSDGNEIKLTENQRLEAIDSNKQVMADNCDE